MKQRQKRQGTWEDRKVREWITANRGVLTRVAVRCQVCEQFVSAVAYGRSTALAGHPVEQILKAEGWPGISRKSRQW